MSRNVIRQTIQRVLRLNPPEAETPIPPQPMRTIWWVGGIAGISFWAVALLLWYQSGLDEWVLFYYNPFRIDYSPIVAVSRWLSSYGMAVITAIYISYLALSQRFKQLNAPLTIYLFILFSFAISGIAGDLLKEVIQRPRPAIAFAGEILALGGGGGSSAIPSGHTTKSIALVLPFLLLVSNRLNLHKFIKLILIVIAVGVSFSRIVLGAHYLSDVLAGVGTAFVGLPFSMLFAKAVLRNVGQEQLPVLSKVWGTLLVFLTTIFLVL